MFSSAKSLNKVESLQKRALRFLYEDYVSSYEELLQKAGKETKLIIKKSLYRNLVSLGPASEMLWGHRSISADVFLEILYFRPK